MWGQLQYSTSTNGSCITAAIHLIGDQLVFYITVKEKRHIKCTKVIYFFNYCFAEQ